MYPIIPGYVYIYNIYIYIAWNDGVDGGKYLTKRFVFSKMVEFLNSLGALQLSFSTWILEVS
jgi:hypothetical protein